MKDVLQCLIIASIALVPMFIFASELDGDEFAKSGMGLAMVAVVWTALRMLERMTKQTGWGGTVAKFTKGKQRDFDDVE